MLSSVVGRGPGRAKAAAEAAAADVRRSVHSGTVSHEEVLDVVMSGNVEEIRRWIAERLPKSGVADTRNEHATCILTQEVEAVVTDVVRRCPGATRKIFLDELARENIVLPHGAINEVWDSVMVGDLEGMRHWVASLPLEETRVNQYGGLLRKKLSLLPEGFIDSIIRVIEKATPDVGERLLDLLATRGVFTPANLPQLYVRSSSDTNSAHRLDFTKLVVRNAATQSLFRTRKAITETNAAVARVEHNQRTRTAGSTHGLFDIGDGLDDDDGVRSTSTFASQLSKASKANANTRGNRRPGAVGGASSGNLRQQDWMELMAPFGKFSEFHYFVVRHLSSFEMAGALEAYVAWYELNNVSGEKFLCRRKELLLPSEQTVVELLEQHNTAAALGSAMMFRPASYNPARDYSAERGVLTYIPEAKLLDASFDFDYIPPLLSRVDNRHSRVTFATATRAFKDMAELRLALQYSAAPEGIWRVLENVPSSRSDSSLFTYIYDQHGLDANKFFRESAYARRMDGTLDSQLSAQSDADPSRAISEHDREQRAMATVRDWLRHRSALGGFQATMWDVKPDTNDMWDGIISMAVRVALANFRPVNPKYDDIDGMGASDEAGPNVEEEVVNTCRTFLDMLCYRDTVDSTTLSLFLDVAEALSALKPGIFGRGNLISHLDEAYQSGRPRRQDLRELLRWQRDTPELLELKVLPQPLRRTIAALGVVFAKNNDIERRQALLRLTSSFFVLYHVRINPRLVDAWRDMDGGVTVEMARWLLALGGIMRVPPDQLVRLLADSNGLFDGYEDVLAHLCLIVGAPQGLLAAPTVDTEHEYDSTLYWLYQMPRVTYRHAQDTEANWLGHAMLRRALQGVLDYTKYDSLLPLLALDFGARRQDCFVVWLLCTEAVTSGSGTGDDDGGADDEKQSAARRDYVRSYPVYSQEFLEKTILRLTQNHRYMALRKGLELFYPKSVLLTLVDALIGLSRSSYNDCKANLLTLVNDLRAEDSGAKTRALHIFGTSPEWEWSKSMARRMMTVAFGIESRFPTLPSYDQNWLRQLFASVKYQDGVYVMAQMEARAAGNKKLRLEPMSFNDSVRVYDEKMEEFDEFMGTDMMMWEYGWERHRFYQDAHRQMEELRLNPVVVGALFYNIYTRLKNEQRTPVDAFTAHEEVQLLYLALYHWRKCDVQTYGETCQKLRARIYCLLLAHDIEGVKVVVGDSEMPMLLKDFFPFVGALDTHDPVLQAERRRRQRLMSRGKSNSKKNKNKKQKQKQKQKRRSRKRQDDEMDHKHNGKLDESDDDDGGDVDDDNDDGKAGGYRLDKHKMEAMDTVGFFRFSPLRRGEFMPDSHIIEERWRRQEQIRLARERGDLEEAEGAAAAAAAGDEEGAAAKKDSREVDEELLMGVMLQLLDTGRFQQAYTLAHDIRETHPEQLAEMRELRQHMDRIRCVFWVCGIDKLQYADLGLPKSARQPGVPERVVRTTDLPPAVNLVGIKWMPDNPAGGVAVINRQRLAWGSSTKIDVYKQLFDRLFPGVDLRTIRKRRSTLDGRLRLLEELRQECPLQLSAITYLMSMSMQVAEVEQKPVPIVVAALAMSAHKGYLPLLASIAETTKRSILDVVAMSPPQIIFELMDRRKAYGLIRQYLALGDVAANSVKHLKDAYSLRLQVWFDQQALLREKKKLNLGPHERRLDLWSRHRMMNYASLAGDRREMHKLGDLMRTESNRIDIFSHPELRPDKNLHLLETFKYELLFGAYFCYFADGHSEGMTGCLRELDETLCGMKKSIRFKHHLRRALFLTGEYKALEGAMGVAVQAEPKKSTKADVKAKIAKLKDKHRREAVAKRKQVYQKIEQKKTEELQERIALMQAKKKTRTTIKFAGDDSIAQVIDESKEPNVAPVDRRSLKSALKKGSSSGGSKSSGGGGAGGASAGNVGANDEPLMTARSYADERKDETGKVRVSTQEVDEAMAAEDVAYDASVMEAVVDDDLEVELNSHRYDLILELLNALQSLQGYELFERLEAIAAGFKTLAWQFQELNWFTQALEMHRINELVLAEIEYLPLKLRRFNWVAPDEFDLNQIWGAYHTAVPSALREKKNMMRSDVPKPTRKRRELSAGDDEINDLMSRDDPAIADPEVLSVAQFAMLVSDCYLSGVSSAYLQQVGQEFARRAQKLNARNKPVGRVYSHLHQVKRRLLRYYIGRCNGQPLTKEELSELIISQGSEMALDVGDAADGGSGDGPAESDRQKYPTTMLFMCRDKFRRWSIGIDDTNSYAAQQTLEILTQLKKSAHLNIFKEVYYGAK